MEANLSDEGGEGKERQHATIRIAILPTRLIGWGREGRKKKGDRLVGWRWMELEGRRGGIDDYDASKKGKRKSRWVGGYGGSFTPCYVSFRRITFDTVCVRRYVHTVVCASTCLKRCLVDTYGYTVLHNTGRNTRSTYVPYSKFSMLYSTSAARNFKGLKLCRISCATTTTVCT